jgi:uncharacterized protein (DUF1330 family)
MHEKKDYETSFLPSAKKAIAIIEMKTDPKETEALEFYKEVAKTVRDEYGAQVLLRSDVKKTLIGTQGAETVRVIAFPSEESIHNWLNDPRYLAVKPLRDKAFSYLTLSILTSK